ncbi:unnamed protein product, partial [Ectocarpus sp. 12 AP-2014]
VPTATPTVGAAPTILELAETAKEAARGTHLRIGAKREATSVVVVPISASVAVLLLLPPLLLLRPPGRRRRFGGAPAPPILSTELALAPLRKKSSSEGFYWQTG